MTTEEQHVQSYFLFAESSPCAQIGCKDVQTSVSKGNSVLFAFNTKELNIFQRATQILQD